MEILTSWMQKGFEQGREEGFKLGWQEGFKLVQFGGNKATIKNSWNACKINFLSFTF